MTYHCTAIFAKGDQSVIDAARQKWKGCLARLVDKPFQGIAFADPGADCCYPLVFNSEKQKEHEGVAVSMKTELARWSKKFPSIIFVFIEADQVGSISDFEGFAVRNGNKLCSHRDKDALRKLLAYLDVELAEDQTFQPFTRGYFHSCREHKRT